MKKGKIKLLPIIVMLMCMMFTMSVSAAPKISKKKATLTVGQTLQLNVKEAKSAVKWSSSKKSVATVSSSGNVTAKKKGTATITAKVGKKKLTCKVTVKKPVSLSETSKTLVVGKSFTLSLKNETAGVKWSTSNKKVATIKKVSKYKYKVTGKKEGTATITAKVGAKKYFCRVTVKQPVKMAFPDQNECGAGTFYIYFASGTSENGKIPEVYVDKSFPFGYVDYCAYDVTNAVPIRVYIDGKQVDIEYVGYKLQKSMSFSKDEMKEGVHNVEMVQFVNNDSKGDVITYRRAQYRVRYR